MIKFYTSCGSCSDMYFLQKSTKSKDSSMNTLLREISCNDLAILRISFLTSSGASLSNGDIGNEFK